MFSDSFAKNRTDNVEKCGGARQAADNIAPACGMLDK